MPLGTASRTPTILVVRSDAPYRNFAELIEYARNRPGQVRIGQPGSGSVGDFCVQLINALTGAELVPIPYAGAAPAVVALRGEHIEGAVLSLGALSAHIKSGAFRGLVSSSRFPEFVDIPTMHELGYQEELFGIWFSFFAPAGSPKVRGRLWSAPSNRRSKHPLSRQDWRRSASCRATPRPSRPRPRSARSSSEWARWPGRPVGQMKPVIQAPKKIYCSKAVAAARASGTTS